MKIVIAPDKLKGSLTAVEAADAIAQGLKDAAPETEVVLCPMADGGEGTVDAIAAATGARVMATEVSGPLPGQKVRAQWAIVPTGAFTGTTLPGEMSTERPTAVIEIAQASGLSLIPDDKRDPMVSSTRGTGELISAALDEDCRQIVVGIGGSGTVDGGTGMAEALGFRFLDADGSPVAPGGGALASIKTIEASGRDPRLEDAVILVASDVDNPLVGKEGAAAIYGPQKGASPRQVRLLEEGLKRLGSLIESQLAVRVLEVPAAGAAGGLGAGLIAFCGARLAGGVELVAELVGLRKRISGADLVITAEGSLDEQTLHGKTPAGVSEIAREAGIPVVIFAGRIQPGVEDLLGPGVAGFCVLEAPMDLDEAMRRAGELASSAASRLVRLLGLLDSR